MSTAIELRFAKHKDIPDATEFVLLALNDTGMENECVELLGNEFTNRLETYGPENMLLAFDKNNNDSIIGFLELNPEKFSEGHYAIKDIFVLPAYRGQGIAKGLVQKMLEEKCSHGEELVVEISKEEDLKHWEKLQFTPKSTIMKIKL